VGASCSLMSYVVGASCSLMSYVVGASCSLMSRKRARSPHYKKINLHIWDAPKLFRRSHSIS
ncbi:MAG: hypothetical protein V7K27_06435, partial [Nostoc sp.]|uniref:hypothetical protein n=1 Tax=Nostoc sp. TaxID=1180 RepID=UPI002FF4FB6E